mgnify:CR=1 FL=1
MLKAYRVIRRNRKYEYTKEILYTSLNPQAAENFALNLIEEQNNIRRNFFKAKKYIPDIDRALNDYYEVIPVMI